MGNISVVQGGFDFDALHQRAKPCAKYDPCMWSAIPRMFDYGTSVLDFIVEI
jgi:hypothetical protein